MTQSWTYGTFGGEMQNTLFKQYSAVYKQNVSIDLLAMNINRGRDHGMPSYAQAVK